MTTNDYASHVVESMSGLDGDERLAGLELVIEQRIEGPDGDDEVWHVSFGDGVVSVASGSAADAQIVITQDRATADGLRTGATNAHRAFLTGRLRIDGDVDLLLEHGGLLRDLLGGESA